MGLLAQTLGFMLSGVDSGCCVGTWRITLLFMSWLGVIVFFGSLLLVLLGMVRFIFCCPELRLLGSLGTRIHVYGRGPVCLLFVSFLVLFSFSALLFGMLGGPRLLVTLVLGLVFGVGGILIFGVLQSFYPRFT